MHHPPHRLPRILVWTALLICLVCTLPLTAGDVSRSNAETSTAETATATFAMYCYWTGEATLGRIDGVKASRIGHWARKEIVQVDYDPQRTDVPTLIAALKLQRSFDAVVLSEQGPADRDQDTVKRMDPRDVIWAKGEPKFIQPKHSLRTRHPKIYALDLNERQAIALNSWSYFGGPMPDVLTDAQVEQLRR